MARQSPTLGQEHSWHNFLLSGIWYLVMFLIIHRLGLLYGFPTYLILTRCLYKLLWFLFKMERLHASDEIFFTSDPRQVGNMIAFQKIEKVDTDKFRATILEKSFQFSRLQSKVVFWLGRPFFKLLSRDVVTKNAKKIIISKTGVHNEKELASFMALQQSVRDRYDFVQWRVFLFEDYTPTESLFVFKVHHSVADDTALM